MSRTRAGGSRPTSGRTCSSRSYSAAPTVPASGSASPSSGRRSMPTAARSSCAIGPGTGACSPSACRPHAPASGKGTWEHPGTPAGGAPGWGTGIRGEDSGRAGLARRADVLGVMALVDLPDSRPLAPVLGVHREQDAARSDLAFVALGLVLGDAGSDEGAGQATDGCADGRTTERRHDRACGDEGTEARDGERAYSSEPAQRATHPDAGAPAGRRAFGCLARTLVRQVTAAGRVREQDGYVVAREPRRT